MVLPMETVWIARWQDGHEPWNEVLGVFSSEEKAKDAIRKDIDARYHDNPNAKVDWRPWLAGSCPGGNVWVSFGCGHFDDYSWTPYDIDECL